MNAIQQAEIIEKYLKDSLSHEERQAFEAQMAENPDLSQAMAQQAHLLKLFQQQARRQQWLAQMEEVHQQLAQENLLKPYRPKPWVMFWQQHQQTIRIAAVVSFLVMSFTWVLWQSIGLFGGYSAKQVAYQELRREEPSNQKNPKKDASATQSAEAETKDVAHKSSESKKEQLPAFVVGKPRATAFVINQQGYWLTTYHAIRDAKQLVLANPASQKRFKVVIAYANAEEDVALLQVQDSSFVPFEPIPYAFRTQTAALGEAVYTLAYPQQAIVYGEGALSAQVGFEGSPQSYQISIPVNPGNSGSPLIDAQGNVLGMVQAKDQQLDGVAFALKSSQIREILAQMPQQKNLPQLLLPQVSLMYWLTRTQQVKIWEKWVWMVEIEK